MKKFTLGLLTGVLFVAPALVLSAPNITEKLKGKILLAVEDKGKTYYVANDGYRYRITSATAQKVFEKLAIGITNDNLSKITEKDLGISAEVTASQPTVSQEKIVEKIVYQDKIVEKLVYTDNCTNTDTSSTNTNQISQPQESYKYDDYYPIILSIKDNKGSIRKSSGYNDYRGNDAYSTPSTNVSLKVGDELVLTIDANDPQGRPLFYNWNSNSRRFNALIGVENGIAKYTTNNELHYTINNDDLQTGEMLRIVSQIRSDKSMYRVGSDTKGGYDDNTYFDYKLLPE